MKSGQSYVTPMPRFVCRLFVALSVSLAPSLRLYAAGHLNMRIMLRSAGNANRCVLLVYFVIFVCKPKNFIAS